MSTLQDCAGLILHHHPAARCKAIRAESHLIRTLRKIAYRRPCLLRLLIFVSNRARRRWSRSDLVPLSVLQSDQLLTSPRIRTIDSYQKIGRNPPSRQRTGCINIIKSSISLATSVHDMNRGTPRNHKSTVERQDLIRSSHKIMLNQT
jgi:hypothetical protein